MAVDLSTLALTITRDGDGPPRVAPESILLPVEVLASDFEPPAADAAHWRFEPAEGWVGIPEGDQGWRVRPRRVNVNQVARFTWVHASGAKRADVTIPIRLDLRSSFRPAEHMYPRPNRASVLGEQPPRREIFEQTYQPMPEPIARTLFEGLYSDIVFLRGGDGRHGGLCSGMARWAIARAQGVEPPPETDARALERIALYHGRQLCDRALLAALPWFARGSPRAAFRAVRADLLHRGMSDRALDIKVPKLWRRDLFTALVVSGHTVVPYRLRQDGPDRGEIDVYDPNVPAAANSDTPRVIRFDLRADRYEYAGKVSLEEDNVGIIAVRQSAYADRGTAYLASLGSLAFAPRRGFASLLGRRGRSARRIGER